MTRYFLLIAAAAIIVLPVLAGPTSPVPLHNKFVGPIALDTDSDGTYEVEPDALVRYAHMFATAGAGTSGSPWTSPSGTGGVQEAINDLPATGGIVRLAPGVYSISASIVGASNVTIVGDGSSSILKAATNLNASVITATGATEFRVRDLAIDGNRANQSGTITEGAAATQQKLHGVQLVAPIRNSVTGCVIKSTKGAGIYIGSPFSSTAFALGNVIADNSIYDAEWAGIWVYSRPVSNNWIDATIDGNNISDSAYVGGGSAMGVGIYGSISADSLGLILFTINGNVINRPGGHGILFNGAGTQGPYGVTITGNVIYRPGANGSANADGISLAKNCEILTISGNVINTPSRNGIRAKDFNNSTVSGNAIQGAGEDGIYLDAASKVTIDSNFILNSGTDSVGGTYGGITLDDHTGSPDGVADVHINNNVMHDNQGSPTQDYGVIITATAVADSPFGDVYVEGNQLRQNGTGPWLTNSHVHFYAAMNDEAANDLKFRMNHDLLLAVDSIAKYRAEDALWLVADSDNDGTGEVFGFDANGDGAADWSMIDTVLENISSSTGIFATKRDMVLRADYDNDGTGEAVYIDANGDTSPEWVFVDDDTLGDAYLRVQSEKTALFASDGKLKFTADYDADGTNNSAEWYLGSGFEMALQPDALSFQSNHKIYWHNSGPEGGLLTSDAWVNGGANGLQVGAGSNIITSWSGQDISTAGRISPDTDGTAQETLGDSTHRWHTVYGINYDSRANAMNFASNSGTRATMTVAGDFQFASGLQVGSLTPGSASCVRVDTDHLYGDIDCDGTKDAGEEYLDLAASAATAAGSNKQLQYNNSGAIGGTPIGVLVDSDGDGTDDALALTAIGSTTGGSPIMAHFVDGSVSANDSLDFVIDPATSFTGNTAVQWKSTGATETVVYESTLPSLLGGYVTTNTNQTSGLTGNKVWGGTAQFDGTSQFNATSTHASDIALASTHGTGANDGTTYWITGPANNPPSATGKWRFGFKSDSDFASENDPLAVLCWNCSAAGGARQDTAVQQWSLQMEANFKTDDDSDGTVDDHVSEFILSYTNPSGVSFRPVYIHGGYDGALANTFQHDFRVDASTSGMLLTTGVTALNAPVKVEKSFGGTLDAGGKSALTLAVTQTNTNDATTGAWYGTTADCTISGAASSGSPGCQGIRGAATWSNANGGTKLHGDVTAGSFVATISRTGTAPTVDASLSIKGFETGWTIPGTNTPMTFGYGADILSPAAFGSGSSVGYTAGIRVRDQKGLGTSQSDALTFDVQTGGSGSKGNLVMDGGTYNDGHAHIGRGATGGGAHLWYEPSGGLRVKNGGAPSSNTDGGVVVAGTESTSHGVTLWGVKTATDASFDTGDEVCQASKLTCVSTADVLGTPIACNSNSHTIDQWLAFCK